MKYLLIASLVLTGCGSVDCLKRCANPQTFVLVKSDGSPLEPLRVTEIPASTSGSQAERVFECSGEDPFLGSCSANRITIHQENPAPHRIRVEAKTGERFEGEISPTTMPTGMSSAGSCSCVLTQRFVDQTLTLTAP